MTAAIGFTVKSGWAAAVLVEQASGGIRVLDSRRVELSDPDVPEARQPYHEGFATMRRSGPVLSRLLRSVRRFGQSSVESALNSARRQRQELAGAGVVVGSLIDPATIANVMEGQLFREVVTQAALAQGLTPVVWRDRDLMATAVTLLKHSDAVLRRRLSDCGESAPKPWRKEQKSAALAAWLILRGGK
jgi:hypothetical protein